MTITDDINRLAHTLFAQLRELDAQNVDVILCVLPPPQGLGLAVRRKMFQRGEHMLFVLKGAVALKALHCGNAQLGVQKGILAKETHEVVVRLAPPLVITRKEIDWAVEQIDQVFKEMS